MKTKSVVYGLASLALLAILSSFSLTAETGINIIVKGAEHKDVLKEGLTPRELTHLTIESKDHTADVIQFEICLARGKSPVAVPVKMVTGNAVGLAEYRPFAKGGDRLVINLTKVSGQKLPDDNIIIIPIR